jgi:hypothetical protein
LFKATTTACGLVFGRRIVLAVWSGEAAPPPGTRCPVCLDADRVLQLMDQRYG